MLRIFTDGSCTHNGRKGARASYGVIYPDKLIESWGAPITNGTQTNQTAELTAIYEGIKKGTTLSGNPAHVDVHIFSDSEYSINCLTKWVSGWKKRDWKTADGKPVVHRELIEKILDQLKLFAGHVFVHVKAHTGGADENSRWNQEADDIARKAGEENAVVMYKDFKECVKVIRNTDSTEEALKGIPLALMGAPVSENDLFAAIKANLGSIDEKHLKSALISALKKTLQSKNYELEKSKVFKTPHYRLIEESHLTIKRLEHSTEDE
jgi:ribonuclease HI